MTAGGLVATTAVAEGAGAASLGVWAAESDGAISADSSRRPNTNPATMSTMTANAPTASRHFGRASGTGSTARAAMVAGAPAPPTIGGAGNVLTGPS